MKEDPSVYVAIAFSLVCIYFCVVFFKVPKRLEWYQELETYSHASSILPPYCFRRNKIMTSFSKAILRRISSNKSRKMIRDISQNRMAKNSSTAFKNSASALTEITEVAYMGGTLFVNKIPDNVAPLLVFVNSKSGGNQGKEFVRELCKLLNYCQIIDLAVHRDPVPILQSFLHIKSCRIVVCGGDGTVGWILDSISKARRDADSTSLINPPIAIFPLGTGNDLANVMGWGQSICTSDMPMLLSNVRAAPVELLDRWYGTFYSSSDASSKSRTINFSNYFGIGVDAQIVLDFHNMRKQSPGHFMSQIGNKLWYGVVGGHQIFRQDCANFSNLIKIFDSFDNEIELPEDSEGVVFCNIDSYGGGSRLWVPHNEDSDEDVCEEEDDDDWIIGGVSIGEVSSQSSRATSWKTASKNDGLLEVLSVRSSLELAQIKCGLASCTKVAQDASFRIEFHCRLPVHMDGEPWLESIGECRIGKTGTVPMCVGEFTPNLTKNLL